MVFILLLFPIALLGQSDSIKSFHIVKQKGCNPLIGRRYRIVAEQYNNDTIPASALKDTAFITTPCGNVTGFDLCFPSDVTPLRVHVVGKALPANFNTYISKKGKIGSTFLQKIEYVGSDGQTHYFDWIYLIIKYR